MPNVVLDKNLCSWAKERISEGWTYGLNEDPDLRRSPHLVPYSKVDDAIKQANTLVSSFDFTLFLLIIMIVLRNR